MGTSGITNLTNDFNLVNVDVSPKGNESNGEFAKTFENVSQQSDLETLSQRGVNVVEELKPADNAKDNYLKETNGGKFDNKVEKAESNVKSNVSDSKVTNEKAKTAIDDETIEANEEAIASVMNAYCEAFGISVEELQSFMEENGLTVSDLLDASNVQSIVMQFNGISDSVEILTDDALYESIQNLETIVEGNALEISDNISEMIPEEPAIEEIVPEVKVSEVPVQAEAKTEIVDHKLVEISRAEDVETTNGLETTAVEDIKVSKPKENTKEESYNENQNNQMNNNVNTNEVHYEAESVNNNQNQFTTNNAQEIYDQIGEYVRNLSTENLNEVELKLQPETLGTLHVRVTQSEGVMKAELVTNNENVRAIIEGQLIQLKEDFDRSGIRVDEVEVRVSTNEFNENTESDSRDEANERAGRQTTTRRIDISDIGDLEEIDEYEDDEKIAVEMMAANGNSMDYRA